MKNYDEIARDVFAYRDEYVARQKRTRKTVMRITSVACAVALVAGGIGVWLSRDSGEIPLEEPNVTTTAPTENDGPGIGGDYDPDYCREHSYMYHLIPNFRGGLVGEFIDFLGENYDREDYNIIAFVEYHGITRDQFMEVNGLSEETMDDFADHGWGCPYTNRQFVEAIYGDNDELREWVFSPELNWPKTTEWPPEGDWPPEGYGFGEVRPTTVSAVATTTTEAMQSTTRETDAPATTIQDWSGPSEPCRDEFGNTTSPQP